MMELRNGCIYPPDTYLLEQAVVPPDPAAAHLADASAEEDGAASSGMLGVPRAADWRDRVNVEETITEYAAETIHRLCVAGSYDVMQGYLDTDRQIRANVSRIATLCGKTGKSVPESGIHTRVIHRVHCGISTIVPKLLTGPAIDRTHRHVVTCMREALSNDALLRMRVVSSIVPPRDMQHLNVRKEEEFTPLRFAPAKELRKNEKLYNQVRTLIAKGFPNGDDEYFDPCFLPDDHAELHVLLCGDMPIMTIGLEGGFPGKLQHATWLCANKASEVHGMAIPFQRAVLETLLEGLEEGGGTFQVARPYASLPLGLALGGVCDALTAPGEFLNKGYLHSRWLPEEQGKYAVRALGEKTIQSALDADGLRPGAVVERTIGGVQARVCRVEFPGVAHHTDVDQDTHWFYRALAEELAAGNVMTALIRAGDWSGGDQPYYAVFEKDLATPQRKEELREARAQHREKQSGFAAIAAAAAAR